MFDPIPSIARTVLVELILREMQLDARNRPYLVALRPVLRTALRENHWAAQAAATGIPLDVLRQSALALRHILTQCGADIVHECKPEPTPPRAATSARHAGKGGRPPKLTPAQRAEASRLRQGGMAVAAIARQLGVSRSTIARL